jgi:dipeptidyl aminopeptidase/acylaminoacyl peptidase
MYGTPQTNPAFWNSVDPNSYLKDITAPLQIDVGLADTEVPPDFSTGLYTRMKVVGKVVQYYEYPGSNHDINQSFTLAIQRTISFFNSYLK